MSSLNEVEIFLQDVQRLFIYEIIPSSFSKSYLIIYFFSKCYGCQFEVPFQYIFIDQEIQSSKLILICHSLKLDKELIFSVLIF